MSLRARGIMGTEMYKPSDTYSAPVVSRVTGSSVAAPAVMPDGNVPQYPPMQPQQPEQQEEKTILGMPQKEAIYAGAEMGTMMMGPLGQVASVGVSFAGAGEHAHNEVKRMVEQYRDQIASVTGEDPAQVNGHSLKRAAEMDERFAKLVDTIEKEKDARPAESASSLAGFIPGAALGQVLIPIPMVGGMIGGTLGAMGAGQYANKLMGNEPEKTVDGAIQRICEKQASGQQVMTADVFAVRLAQNEYEAERIENEKGHPFYKLDPMEQAEVMKDPENQAAASQCYYDALALNQGGNPMDFLMGRVAPQGGQFTQAVQAGRPQKQAKNFREAILNQVADGQEQSL